MAEPFCPVHDEVKQDILRIEGIQRERPCGRHEERLSSAEKANTEQWTEINRLNRLVYIGMGMVMAAAGLGSFLGNLLFTYLKKGG